MARKKEMRYAGLGGTTSQREGSLITDCDSEALGDLVRAVVAVGDAVLFGQTADGSAVRVLLFSGDEKQSTYFGASADIDNYCRRVRQHIEDTLS